MKINDEKKYTVQPLNNFSKQLKKVKKQGKKIEKIEKVITDLSKGKKLDEKYRDHALINDKNYQDCRECHIEPDWLLIYKIDNNKIILILLATGSHSELFY